MKKIKKSISFLFNICHDTDKSILPLLFFSVLLDAVAPLFITLFTKHIVNDLYDNNTGNVIYTISLYLGLYLLLSSLAIVFEGITNCKKEKIIRRQYLLFADKIMKMDLELLDNYGISLQKEKARKVITWNSRNVDGIKNSLGSIFQSVIRIVYCCFFLSFLHVGIIVIVVACVVLWILDNYLFKKKERRLYENSIGINQEKTELNKIINDIGIIKKSKINNYNNYLLTKSRINQEKGDRFQYTIKENNTNRAKIDELILLIQKSALYLILVFELFKQSSTLTLGDFSFFISITLLFSSSCTAFFNSLVGLNDNADYVNDFIDFIALADKMEKKGKIKADLANAIDIEFKNVSFKYNETQDWVLRDINLKIKKGELITVAGLNGAGKTTLIKLLMRLYEPTSGEILLNGVNIKDIDYDSYLAIFAPVFQDFQIYNFKICENIALKNYDELNEKEIGLIVDIIKKIDLYDAIYALDDDIYTKIGSGYYGDSIELSTGQSQKIAISRAYYKTNKIAVLDEPYSNLSILDEYNVCQKIVNNMNFALIIFISHRLNAINQFSRIIFIKDNRIVEDGDYVALMQKKGEFYNLYHRQAVEERCVKDEE